MLYNKVNDEVWFYDPAAKLKKTKIKGTIQRFTHGRRCAEVRHGKPASSVTIDVGLLVHSGHFEEVRPLQMLSARRGTKVRRWVRPQ